MRHLESRTAPSPDFLPVRKRVRSLPMNSMRNPLNTEQPHHLHGNKLTSPQHTALAMASSLQPLQRSADSKHRLEVQAVSDTSSPESVGKNRPVPGPDTSPGPVPALEDVKEKMAVSSDSGEL